MSITAEMTRLLERREALTPGWSLWQADTIAAWKLAQMRAGIPACDWTDTPPADFGPASLQERSAA